MKRSAPLKRQRLPPRAAPLRRQSRAHRQQQAGQRGAYGAAEDAGQVHCCACGRAGATDHCHLLTQGQHKQHRNDPRNWVRMCRVDHELFEHNRRAFAATYPVLWAYILRRIKDLDPMAYEFYRLKNPY